MRLGIEFPAIQIAVITDFFTERQIADKRELTIFVFSRQSARGEMVFKNRPKYIIKQID